ncbi:MAG TPA: rod shape-determining protein [Caulobacteraceae bacterium]|nr:rod shape-determining protein [Caulobacteraceae bacterium]
MTNPWGDLKANDLAIDLGTANTVIYERTKGIVLNEPSVLALAEEGGRTEVCAVGAEAKDMVGRLPPNITTVRPLRDGVVADFKAAEDMVRAFIQRARTHSALVKPRIVVGAPPDATPVERRAIAESCVAAGARRVELIDEAMAAAIGAGVSVDNPAGSMVVDIGGGTTSIAVVARSRVVFSRSIRMGGDKMDEAIMGYMRHEQDVLVGERTAERIKLEIGRANAEGCDGETLKVRCRDAKRGVVRAVHLTCGDIAEALAEPVRQIVAAVVAAIEATPPELTCDIAETGVILTGGGALLRGLDEVIGDAIGLPVVVAAEPLACVAAGCGELLEREDWWRRMAG